MNNQPRTIADDLFNPEIMADKLSEAAEALQYLLGFGDACTGDDLAEAIQAKISSTGYSKTTQGAMLFVNAKRLAQAAEELRHMEARLEAGEMEVIR